MDTGLSGAASGQKGRWFSHEPETYIPLELLGHCVSSIAAIGMTGEEDYKCHSNHKGAGCTRREGVLINSGGLVR